MNALMLAAYLVSFECYHNGRTSLETFPDREHALIFAELVYDKLSEETRARCEINVKEVKDVKPMRFDID